MWLVIRGRQRRSKRVSTSSTGKVITGEPRRKDVEVGHELARVGQTGFLVQLKINLPLCISVATCLPSKRMKTKRPSPVPCASPGA